MGGDLNDDNAQRELLGEGTEPGAFERAEGGILFIQELGELGTQAQRILLSALEQGTYRVPGQSADRPFSCRILSTAFPGFERSDMLRPELLSHLSVVVISSSCFCAAAKSGSSRSAWGWSARIFTASCARWAWTFASR